MHTFFAVLGFVGVLLVLGLAVVGVLALVAVASGDDERRRIQEQARQAERQIMEIGQQAQLAILGEALRRAYRSSGRHTADDTTGEAEGRQ